MKRIFLLGMLMVLWAWTALAQGPLPEVDPGAGAKSLFDGISTGEWIGILAGGGLVLIYLLRLLLLPNLKGKALAITSTALIGLAGVATTMVTGAGILEAIGVGFGAALVAGKAWDLIPEKITDAAEKPIKKRANK